jgi:hypothetical protein
MSVTAAHIARVRSLSGATATDFSDAAITAVIELFEVMDGTGYEPSEDGYSATYDLYAAAADVVDQRSVAAATAYDTSADGATLSRNQVYQNLCRLASRLRSRSQARLVVIPNQDTTVDNDDEDDD